MLTRLVVLTAYILVGNVLNGVDRMAHPLSLHSFVIPALLVLAALIGFAIEDCRAKWTSLEWSDLRDELSLDSTSGRIVAGTLVVFALAGGGMAWEHRSTIIGAAALPFTQTAA